MACTLTYELLGEHYSVVKYISQIKALDSVKDVNIESCLCFAIDVKKLTGHKNFSIIPLDEIKTIQNLSSILSKV